MTLARQLAEYASRLTFGDLSSDVVHQTKRVLLDTLGCAIGGYDSEAREAIEAYIRESILNPAAKVVEGYMPDMPVFQGLVTEENVVQLIEYVKSLTPRQLAPNAPTRQAALPPAAGSTPSDR